MGEIFQEKEVGDAKGTTQISSGGLPQTLTLGKIVDRPSFSFDSLTALQESKQLTDNETLEVAKYLSYEAGKSSFEKNLKRKLTERNHSVDNFFEIVEFDMRMKLKKKKKRERAKQTRIILVMKVISS